MRERSFLSPRWRPLLRAAAALSALAIGVDVSLAGCSLGNLDPDECTKDSECAASFGLGSKCSDGYCVAPEGCETSHDCHRDAGGICVKGKCQDAFVTDASCSTIIEPPDLLDGHASGPDAPVVFGAIFSSSVPKDVARSQAVRLAVKEINRTGGLDDGRKIGVVVCDVGDPMKVTGDARTEADDHAVDYLAGTLGVPYIVGPSSSDDSIKVVNRLVSKGYPTVVISPSATSPDLTVIIDRLDPKDPYGLFWRTCPTDLLQGEVLAKDVIPIDLKVTIVYLQDTYGEGLANVFNENRTEGTTALVPFDLATLADAQALADLVTQIDAGAPDAVLVIALHGNETRAILDKIDELALPVAQKPFYFTDGSKDANTLFAEPVPPGVVTILTSSRGTAPARPSGPNYDIFVANLQKEFGVDASSFSFLAQSYDAAYVGAYGVVWASQKTSGRFDGLDVAEGMANLSSGTTVKVAATDWNKAKGTLVEGKPIDVEGTSGSLDFDPATGEAPGPIEQWTIVSDASGVLSFSTL